MTTMNALRTGYITVAVSLLAACGGGGSGGETENLAGKQSTFTIGGTVSGLTITTGQPAPAVVVANQITGTPITTVTVSGNSAFTFAPATPGTSYVLSLTSPVGYSCVFSNANNSGSVGSASISNIDIACTPGEQLHLATITPSNGSTAVARDTALSASFLSQLNPSTVNTNTVSLLSGVGNERITPSASGNQITVLPSDGPLLPATAYTLNITNQIRGSNGQLPAAAITSTFTTRDGVWSTFAPFGNVAYPDPARPQIVMDGPDSAWAVWSQFTGLYSVPRLARYFNGAWTVLAPPYAPTFLSNGTSIFAKVAANSHGDAALVWTSDDNLVASIYPRTGSAWNGQQVIDTTTGILFAWDLAIDAQGNVFAAWIREINGVPTLFARRYDLAGATWGNTIELQSDATSNLRIMSNARGDTVVAWTATYYDQSNNFQSNNYARIYTRATGSWSNAARIDAVNTFTRDPAVVIDNDGNVIAAWTGGSGSNITTWSNRFDAGTATWGTPTILGTDGLGEKSRPVLAMNANGNAIAIWWQQTANSVSVQSKRYSAATRAWSATLPIGPAVSVSGYQNLTSLYVGMDAAGNAIATRLHGTYSVNHFLVDRYVAATNTWSPSNVTRNINGYGPAVLAMHPRGNAIVAISDFVGSAFGLEFVTFR